MAGRYFGIPFAATGDKTTTPDAVQPDGSVSYAEGFGFDYERPNTDPAYKPVPRDGMNGLFYDITEAVGIIQGQGYADWSAQAAPYNAAATVVHGGEVWISAIGNNSSEPGIDTNWLLDGFATKAEAETNDEATANNSKRMTPLRVLQAITANTPASTDGLAGSASALKASASGTSATVSVSADAICVKDSAGRQKVIGPLALAINSAAVGVNGLDTGALTASTWYSVWVIWNGATAAGLLSLSETAPTLPAGYTHKARVGWIRTDGTANKFPLSFTQAGRKVFYKVSAGSNLTRYPAIAAGVQGNVATPTWVSVSLTSAIPPTASIVHYNAFFEGLGASMIFAPNNSFGSVDSITNVPPLIFRTYTANNSFSSCFSLPRESDNAFYASVGTESGVNVIGWEDNL